MQIFKCFFKIVRRNVPSIAIYFVIFIALSVGLAQMWEAGEKDVFSDESIRMTMIDRDHSALSEALKKHMASRNEIVALPDDKERLQDELFYRNTKYILIFPEGMEENLKSGKSGALTENVKLPGSNSGYYLDRQVNQYLKSVRAYWNAGYDIEDSITYAKQDSQTSAEVTLLETQKPASRIPSYFRYLPYILMSVIISTLGQVMMSFNKRELQNRIECSAVGLFRKNFQLALGAVVLSLILWSLLMLVAFSMFGKEMGSTIGLISILNSFVFLFVCAAIAYLIGIVVKKNEILSGIANVIGLGSSFLCGIFVPLQFLNEKILVVSKFLPAYWYIRVTDKLAYSRTIGSGDIRQMMVWILVEAGFAAAIFAVALVVSRQRKMSTSGA